MGALYTDPVLLFCGTVTTPTNGDIVGKIPSLNHNFLITDIMVSVETAGAQAASALRVRTDEGSPTTIGEVTVGTNAARTNLHTQVAEASRERTAGTGAEIVAITTDASAVYHFQVWGTPNHI